MYRTTSENSKSTKEKIPPLTLAPTTKHDLNDTIRKNVSQHVHEQEH